MSVTLAQASTIVDVALKKARDSNLAPLTLDIARLLRRFSYNTRLCFYSSSQ